jgi:hypothetical protein
MSVPRRAVMFILVGVEHADMGCPSVTWWGELKVAMGGRSRP